jgi:uncharacterized protein
MIETKSEIRDGMRIDWDVPITMDDGLVLRADVFRPLGDGRHPAMLTYGPYAKGLSFQEGYPSATGSGWQAASRRARRLEQQVPELGTARPREVGAARLCLRARRLARLRPLARRVEHVRAARDARLRAECIEWAATQPWSSGKVGLNGVSYFGINQWQVARASRRTWRRSASGKARPTGTAT